MKVALSDIIPWKNYLGEISSPLVIAGPCSVESEQQIMDVSRELAAIPGVRILRGGIWKPRTRPGEFQGIGEPALVWMKNASKETGLLTAVEVAAPSHIEQALKYGIDILWIGARTVVNPFSVQELASVLQGLDIPVMVKNPINPDLMLWIGALERFSNAGIKKLSAIHRGFSHYTHSPYRNLPHWEIFIELKRLVPELPVICDPSHIAGKRILIPSLVQAAMELEYDGLMIEVHPDPERAMTDGEQQITPFELSSILKNLQYRKVQDPQASIPELTSLRKEIDRIDHEMIRLLARRMEVVMQIYRIKKEHNLSVLQIKRWRELIDDRISEGKKAELSSDFIKDIMQAIHAESLKLQNLYPLFSAEVDQHSEHHKQHERDDDPE